jgi:hypothetical protein
MKADMFITAEKKSLKGSDKQYKGAKQFWGMAASVSC